MYLDFGNLLVKTRRTRLLVFLLYEPSKSKDFHRPLADYVPLSRICVNQVSSATLVLHYALQRELSVA